MPRYGSVTSAVPGSAGAFQLTSMEEHFYKLKSAVAARKHRDDILIFARTSAYQVGGCEELCSRLNYYAACGVDGVHIIGTPSERDWREISSITMPMQFPCGVIVSGKQNVPDEVLLRLGVKVRLGPHKPHLAAAHAAYESIRIQASGAKEKEPPQIDPETFRSLSEVSKTNFVQMEYLRVSDPCEGVKGAKANVSHM